MSRIKHGGDITDLAQMATGGKQSKSREVESAKPVPRRRVNRLES